MRRGNFSRRMCARRRGRSELVPSAYRNHLPQVQRKRFICKTQIKIFKCSKSSTTEIRNTHDRQVHSRYQHSPTLYFFSRSNIIKMSSTIAPIVHYDQDGFVGVSTPDECIVYVDSDSLRSGSGEDEENVCPSSPSLRDHAPVTPAITTVAWKYQGISLISALFNKCAKITARHRVVAFACHILKSGSWKKKRSSSRPYTKAAL